MEKLQYFSFGKRYNSPASISSKKMKEHFSSKTHRICLEQLQHCANDQITKCMDALNQKRIQCTCRVFNTVYSLVKQNRPFSDIEDEVELQIKNGVNMGYELHSRKTAVKIVDHIAKEIKSEVFAKITEQNKKICIIIDEASIISSKPVLVIFVKIETEDFLPTIFWTWWSYKVRELNKFIIPC